MTHMAASNPLADRATEACLQCVHWCSACVDEGLTHDPASMAASIRLCHECEPVCGVCATLLSGNSQFAHELCSVCADICEACAAECGKHKHSETMRKSAKPAPAVLRRAGRLLKLGPFERPHRTGIFTEETIP
jgi:hypothetical protein